MDDTEKVEALERSLKVKKIYYPTIAVTTPVVEIEELDKKPYPVPTFHTISITVERVDTELRDRAIAFIGILAKKSREEAKEIVNNLPQCIRRGLKVQDPDDYMKSLLQRGIHAFYLFEDEQNDVYPEDLTPNELFKF